MIQPPAAHPGTDSIFWALPVWQREWALTPPAVQDYSKSQHQQIHALQNQLDQLPQQLETLQGQLEQTSQPSNKPPSSDAPFTTPRRQRRKSSGTRGGQTGHCGTGPPLLSPTEVHLLEPGPGPCGHGTLVAVTPYYTHHRLWATIDGFDRRTRRHASHLVAPRAGLLSLGLAPPDQPRGRAQNHPADLPRPRAPL